MQSLKLNEDGHGQAMRDDLPLKRSWESARLQGQGVAGLVECAERYLHKEMTKKTLRLCCGTWGAQNEGG